MKKTIATCVVILTVLGILVVSEYSQTQIHHIVSAQQPAVASPLPSQPPTSPVPTEIPVEATASAIPVQLDLALTPGDAIPNLALDELCMSGYTASVRNVSVSTKKKVFEEYGLSYPQPEGMYEVDHLIPLELGGSNSVKNLWPESALPQPGFHEKDKVENYLHDQVCEGVMSIEQAQQNIIHNWNTIYTNMIHKKTR